MTRIVDAQGLNFRKQPKIADNVIEVLHLGQPVEVQEAADNGYVKVAADVRNRRRVGFVAEKFLRDPVGKYQEALVQQATHEWKRFNYGLGEEHKSPYFRFVKEMWNAIGLNLDGQDRDVPWSAAAISFMVRNAGKASRGSKYGKFRFAAAHSRYVHDSIKRRESGDKTAPFWGYRLAERKPQIGDMVCRARAGSGVDYDHAREHEAFKSHCDIIVRVMPDTVIALGGNVSHSVKTTEYDKTPDGFLDSTKQVYALLANMHD